MYEEYLGQGYYDKVRKMLTANEELLPDRIIDADLNIGGMKKLLAPALDKMIARGKEINSEEQYSVLQEAGLNYLCGILCLALKSRTAKPPYNLQKYKKNWDKKKNKFMQKGNLLMRELINNVN
jgi:hypothetical protein